MTLAYYADDFTGAVDSMLQFRRAGLAGVLSTGIDGVPRIRAGSGDDDRDDDTEGLPDVIGIAGVARSLPTEDLEAEVGPALTRLAATGARVVQYKACSTADSSPERGSLGRVCEIALERLGPQRIPAVFAQPSFGRFTFFGHHFAAEAGEVFRLDRQPTMRNHPVTPMTESELARHLGAQTALPVETLNWIELEAAGRSGDDATVIERLAGSTGGIVVCDAFDDTHLETLGRAILAGASAGAGAGAGAGASASAGAGARLNASADAVVASLASAAAGSGPRFVLGSGGLSLGIGRAVGGGAPELPTSAPAAAGPCLVLSGSRSAQTWAQIGAAVAAGWRCVDLRTPGAVAEAVALHAAGHHTILQTTDPSGASMNEGDIVSGLAAAGRECLRRRPETRLVLCGGDTCGAILRELGVSSLTLSAAPWGNVVLCEGAGRGGGIEAVLKGGQMGRTGLLEDVRLGREHTSEHDTRK